MHASRLVWRLAAIASLHLAQLGSAPAKDDPYLAVKANAAGTVNYVRRSEIEALVDVSPSDCMVILSDDQEIRVFEKCAWIAAELQHSKRPVSFPNEFGMVFVSPSFIFNLVSTNISGCRVNLKNRKSVSINQSCESVHQALPHE